MNHIVTIFAMRGDIKKYAAVAIATVVFVLSLPVMAVFSMGGDVVQFLSNTPSAISAEQQGFYMGPPVPGDTYAWGNCTYWAFAMRYWAEKPIPTSWGNANTWDDNARSDGYLVDHTPLVGAVMQTDEGDWGHVAYVSQVDVLSGQWTISEMNAPHLNVVSTRTFDPSAASFYSFIHLKIGIAQ